MKSSGEPIPEPRLHVVLVQPEIASNVGNIGRTCVAVGAALWLVRPLGFHLDDRHLKRAGLDYWPHLQWQAVNDLAEIREQVRIERLWYFSTRASTPYTRACFQPGDALVFGSESRGLPRSWIEQQAEWTLRIPMAAEARSLNLANSVAIGVYEAVRQIDLERT